MTATTTMTAEYLWLAKHSGELDKFAGKWIAVIEGKVLGVANTLKELLALPEVKKTKQPFVTKVPKPEETTAIYSTF